MNFSMCHCGHPRGAHAYPKDDCNECECGEFSPRAEPKKYAARDRGNYLKRTDFYRFHKQEVANG